MSRDTIVEVLDEVTELALKVGMRPDEVVASVKASLGRAVVAKAHEEGVCHQAKDLNLNPRTIRRWTAGLAERIRHAYAEALMDVFRTQPQTPLTASEAAEQVAESNTSLHQLAVRFRIQPDLALLDLEESGRLVSQQRGRGVKPLYCASKTHDILCARSPRVVRAELQNSLRALLATMMAQQEEMASSQYNASWADFMASLERGEADPADYPRTINARVFRLELLLPAGMSPKKLNEALRDALRTTVSQHESAEGGRDTQPVTIVIGINHQANKGNR